MKENEFKLNIGELSFFEKAEAVPDKQRRIGGIASIETKDRQKELLLQRGLDFNEFVNYGWFNDNHSRATADILGYPEEAYFFNKGDKLPNGQTAKAPGHWVEGYLLKGRKKADDIWELANSLKGTPRRLGFSVEGKIQKRDALDKSIVAKAIVREVAITKSPVNTDAQMDILAKSLTVGTPTPGQAIVGDKSGEGAAQVLSKESLEKEKKKKKEKETKKALSDSQAFSFLSEKYPNYSPELIGRIISVTKALKRKNAI